MAAEYLILEIFRYTYNLHFDYAVGGLKHLFHKAF